MKTEKPKRRKRGQNEGSIYKHPDGRWRAIVPARYSKTGKRFVIVGSKRNGNTREDVAKKLALTLAGNPGVTVSAARDSVGSFLMRWLDSVATRIRPKTLESYTHTVHRLIIPAIGPIKLQALEPHHVVAMMTKLKNEKRSIRSVAYSRSILRIALTDAKRWQLVPRNVADREYVDPPRIPQREVDAHDAATITKILAKVPDDGDRLLLRTIATFGLRIGEALALRWRDIDLASKHLRVVRAVQRQKVDDSKKRQLVFVDVKTKRSQRALLMPHSLVAEYQKHRKAQLKSRIKIAADWKDHDLVFPTAIGTPQDSRNVLRVLHDAERKAKVEVMGLHKLRNSAATILLTQGVPLDVVSDILGHSSVRLTKDTYAQFVVARQEQAAAVMNDIFSARPKKA
jgi:integrase